MTKICPECGNEMVMKTVHTCDDKTCCNVEMWFCEKCGEQMRKESEITNEKHARNAWDEWYDKMNRRNIHE